jgi:thiamine biosynthesis lipoprotein
MPGYVQASHTFKAMGSPCSFQLFHSNKKILDHAIELAQQEVVRLESKYSRFLSTSQLSKINQASGKQSIAVDPETAGLLNYAALCFEQSDGLFDITSGALSQAWNFKSETLPTQKQIEACLPFIGFDKLKWDGESIYLPKGMQIDFGGVVKEFAADCARQVLLDAGIEYGLVDLAGDMAVIGCKPNGSPWMIGIRDPVQPNQAVTTVPLSKGAIATSGYYERYIMVNGQRYCHIMNPITGWPVQHCATVSVVSERCVVSGSIATIAMLKQETAVDWLQELEADYYLQDRHGQSFSHYSPQ